METVKEKLAKLISESNRYFFSKCDDYEGCEKCPHHETKRECSDVIVAEFLIQNGVTIQEWVSVDEPPKEDGKCLLLFEDGSMCDAIYEVKRGQFGIYEEYWNAVNGWFKVWQEANPTHWMPVPLPQPPKEVQ